ncbi:uncharacterized protein AMSG_11894 [Thecamonas trahens ATCC 50062]|uniref:Uncharacterized protein n=1 Tax=Thecamonas trahens ATCC 50062 TaxID=461836 RepID=A0A0L0DBK2_THETB|nr:hypothetical protein AMSG_11894 [Thecamonas trahens ATCC 50062]KNC49605.1 hypothetical protein AMSG_11894 [Thecamonas trahens ATCC 50062]|eukprot:XP_013757768.1 hypothetical protein AMSG_11894 [Thecamonas trahens ATCC 50062]
MHCIDNHPPRASDDEQAWAIIHHRYQHRSGENTCTASVTLDSRAHRRRGLGRPSQLWAHSQRHRGRRDTWHTLSTLGARGSRACEQALLVWAAHSPPSHSSASATLHQSWR